jgi:short chain dehydrogenase
VWVNNAVATVFGPADGISPEEFKRVSEVTYLGQVYGTLAALTHMRALGGGTIVQVGSALAYRSIPLQPAYCAAKAAVRGFTDSLRSELIHERSAIRLSMVHLPAVNTPQFDWARNRLPLRPQPVPPIHDPAVAAEAIFRAAREAPRELWVGLPTVQAILGTMAVPGLMDRMMAGRAWDGQMTTEPSSPRPDNLFQPATGDWAPQAGSPMSRKTGPSRSQPRLHAGSPQQQRSGSLQEWRRLQATDRKNISEDSGSRWSTSTGSRFLIREHDRAEHIHETSPTPRIGRSGRECGRP